MLGRDIFYAELAENIAKPGCPICNIITSREEGIIRGILYERVNDPDMRSKIRESLGLCPYHAWLLLKVSQSDPLLGEPGPAIIYRDMVQALLRKGWENYDQEHYDEKCYICGEIKDTEEAVIDEIVMKFSTTDLLEKYERSELSMLCLHHYKIISDKLRRINREKAFELRRIQEDKIKRLLDRLTKFIDSYSYDSSLRIDEGMVNSTYNAIVLLKSALSTYLISLRRK